MHSPDAVEADVGHAWHADRLLALVFDKEANIAAERGVHVYITQMWNRLGLGQQLGSQ